MKKDFSFKKVNNGFTIEERSRESNWDVTGRYVVETASCDLSKLAESFISLIFDDMKNLRFNEGSIEVEIEELETQGFKDVLTEEERSNLPF